MGTTQREAIRRYAGAALNDAVKDPPKTAEMFGWSPRHERRKRDGQHPSWVSDTVENMEKLADSGGNVYRVALHFMSAAKRIALRGMSTSEKIDRYHALEKVEHDYEARQNLTTNQREPHKQILAYECHASVLTEMSGLLKELEVLLGCHPRDYRRD